MHPRRAVVIHPPVSVARDFIDYPWFSDLGAVQLAAVLDAPLVDAFALPASGLRRRADGRVHLGAPVADVIERVPMLADTIVVAFTPFHRPPRRDDLLADLLAGLRLERPGATIVLADCYQSGQHYVEADGAQVLAAYREVDAWVKYEAEVTLPALLASTTSRPQGVYRGVPPELDALPPPAWDRIDLAAYARFHARVVEGLGRGHWSFPILDASDDPDDDSTHPRGLALPLVTSRGCPFECVHCSSNPDRLPGQPKIQRRLSPVRLGEQIDRLVRLGATRLHLLDELVNVSARHFDAVLDALDRAAVAYEIPNGVRADHLEPRHLERMRGRVTTVSVSAESGSQRVIDEVVRKRLDLAAVDRIAAAARAAGVPLLVHFIIGLPGETAEEINTTLAFAIDLWERHGAWPSVQYATPLPGTALAARHLPVVDELDPDWDGDWGPRFQHVPSQPDALVSAADLRRFKWTFDQRLAAVAARGPRKLVLNLTYVCNNHCTFCAVGTRTQLHGDPARQREHLARYRRLGVRMVDFDGGEPTLDPELIPLIRYAHALGYERIHVTTNGRLCYYPELASRLMRSGLTSIAFSLHGADAQTHAQQVGVAEAFEQTVGGIRNAVQAAPPNVEIGINVTLTKGNFRQLDRIAQLTWDLGIRWLNLQFLTPFGRATRMVAPDTTEAAAVAMQVIDRWRERMKLQVINLPFCFMPGYEQHLAGDLAKLERHMVFVNNEEVNLSAYLAARRVRKPVCASCPHAVFCGGFYELDDVPEPPWLIQPEDLLRR